MRTFSQIYEVYEDVLYNILNHLSRGDLDNDLPTINKNAAYSFVKDAFGISEKKHDEILIIAKTRVPPEIHIDNDVLNESEEENMLKIKSESFCYFTPNINNFEALEAHCCLMKILLKHQLEMSQTPHFYWDGNFNFLARSILLLHAESKFLTETNIAFTQWAAFTEIHQHHPLNLAVFIEILESVVDEAENVLSDKNMLIAANVFLPACFGLAPQAPRTIKEPLVEKTTYSQLKSKDELIVKMFWDACHVLSESFAKFIGKLHEENEFESVKYEILRKAFVIVHKIKKIEFNENPMNFHFEEAIKESITSEMSKYLLKSVNKKSLASKNNETRLTELIKLAELENSEFSKLTERFGSLFDE